MGGAGVLRHGLRASRFAVPRDEQGFEKKGGLGAAAAMLRMRAGSPPFTPTSQRPLCGKEKRGMFCLLVSSWGVRNAPGRL